MFNYNSIVSDSELTVRFKEAGDNTFVAIDPVGNEEVGKVTVDGATFEASDDKIFMQYKLWQTRPERTVGKKVEIQGKNMEDLIDIYEELLAGACILSQKLQVSPNKPSSYARAIEWLRTTDFYKAPASTKYHESFPGGLLVHSLNVYNKMLDLIQIPEFNRFVSVADATIVALVHDWCKIGYYEAYQKNVKNDKTGEWEKVTAYTVNQKGVPLGHGVTSMFLAMSVMRLTVEQALAIRWHMGEYNVADNEVNELQKANANYPMVYLIQFADRLSCAEY